MLQKVFAASERPALLKREARVWLLKATSRQALRAAAHDFVEALLACYSDPGSEWAVQYAPGQAPRTQARWQGLPLALSLSYAGDHALVALCPGAQIGVDLVRLDTWPELLEVARLYLGPAQTATLQGLSRDAQTQAFAEAWAALEARCKCGGAGLVEWSTERDAQLADAELSALAVPPGYAAAQAVCRLGVLDSAPSPSAQSIAQESPSYAPHLDQR